MINERHMEFSRRWIGRLGISGCTLAAWAAASGLTAEALHAAFSMHWMIALCLVFISLLAASVGIWLSEHIWARYQRRRLRRTGDPRLGGSAAA